MARKLQTLLLTNQQSHKVLCLGLCKITADIFLFFIKSPATEEIFQAKEETAFINGEK